MTRRVLMTAACPYPAPQGSQALIRETARALHDAGCDVRLLVYAHGVGRADDPFPVERGPAIPGYRRTAAGPSWAKPVADAALMLTLRRTLREFEPDVVHAHNYEGLLVALLACRGRRVPVVYHAHNAMADELGYYLRPSAWFARIGEALDRTLPRRADAVIAPHARLADELVARGCDRNRVHVIPPPVYAEGFAPGPRAPAPKPALLYTGNLDAYQNLGRLGELFAAIRRRIPDAELRIATAAPCDRIATVLGPRDGVTAVPTPDLAALREELARDAVVLCPRVSWSGYPIKTLNAMAAGLPVVAFASSAHPLRHGETGWVVPDGDLSAFAEGAVALLRDPALRLRLGETARAYVRDVHAPDRIAAAIDTVYACVLDQASSRASRG